MKSIIPSCKFPSTAILLDDNHDFLLNFVLHLDEAVAYKTFEDANMALSYINTNHADAYSLNKHCLSFSDKSAATQSLIKLDAASMHKEIYNKERFNEVSVVVVDYDMPTMNGLDFCKQINNKNIKKILLSGKADANFAIEAFNEGIIDRYVDKSDKDVTDKIIKHISELQQQHFNAMSDTIINMLAIDESCCIHDPEFAALFNDICQQNNIVEYYLIDNCGSYLMLDDDANVSALLTNLDSLESPNMTNITQLKTTSRTYYYTWSQLPIEVQRNKILSYHRHLENLDAEALLTE